MDNFPPHLGLHSLPAESFLFLVFGVFSFCCWHILKPEYFSWKLDFLRGQINTAVWITHQILRSLHNLKIKEIVPGLAGFVHKSLNKKKTRTNLHQKKADVKLLNATHCRIAFSGNFAGIWKASTWQRNNEQEKNYSVVGTHVAWQAECEKYPTQEMKSEISYCLQQVFIHQNMKHIKQET